MKNMSINISLNDNSIHTLDDKFAQLSDSFKVGETFHLHADLEVFNKIIEFGEYYLQLSNKDQKMFNNLNQIWDDNGDIKKWCENFLEISPGLIVEITNQSHKVNIKPLTELCCFQLARLIKGKKVDEIREIFKVENDFSENESKFLEDETEWFD